MEYLELTVAIDAGGERETENLFGVALSVPHTPRMP